MTKLEKMNVINAPAVAYYSAFGGIEIKAIENGFYDRVSFVAGAWCSDKTAHNAVVHYDSARPYFMYRGNRVHLDDCIRC